MGGQSQVARPGHGQIRHALDGKIGIGQAGQQVGTPQRSDKSADCYGASEAMETNVDHDVT